MSQRQFINFASPLETLMSPDDLLQHENSDILPPRLSGNHLIPQEDHPETATQCFWQAEYTNGSDNAPQVWSPSRDPQEPSGSFQDYFQFQMDHSFAVTEAYTSSKPGEQAFWDLASANTSNLLMTTHTSPPYILSPGPQQPLNAVIDPQQIRRENIMLLVPETYDSANESFRSCYSSSTRSSPSIKMEYPIANNIESTRSPAPVIDDESEEDGSSSLEPYAQLIYRALKSVAGHAMVLKEIYEWFEKNTDKAKDPCSKGWQNSIRHNLSMNGAFQKVEQVSATDETKKGYIWVLEDSALTEGVKSTTRYRKHNPNKKVGKGETAVPQRQRSGAKGGKAARKSAKMRRSSRMDGPRPFSLEEDTPALFNSTSMMESHPFSSDSTPYYLQTSTPPVEPLLPEDHHYSYPGTVIYPLTSPDVTYPSTSPDVTYPSTSPDITHPSTSPDEGLFYETLVGNRNDSMLTAGPFYDPDNVFFKNEPRNMG